MRGCHSALPKLRLLQQQTWILSVWRPKVRDPGVGRAGASRRRAGDPALGLSAYFQWLLARLGALEPGAPSLASLPLSSHRPSPVGLCLRSPSLIGFRGPLLSSNPYLNDICKYPFSK